MLYSMPDTDIGHVTGGFPFSLGEEGNVNHREPQGKTSLDLVVCFTGVSGWRKNYVISFPDPCRRKGVGKGKIEIKWDL